MTKVRFWNPAADYLKHKDEFDAAIQDVLTRGDLILRKDGEEFEARFAEYVGTKYAIAMNSGTDALMLSLQYHQIGPGDRIAAPSYTFRATVDTAARTGAEVVLYDKGEQPDFNNITVWMPAHIAGEVEAWIPEKIKEAQAKDILVIEDAAQAIGAAPVMGVAACYSFYPAKILGCFGDGGAVATNDPDMADWLKRARNHFKGEEGPIGTNSRLDNLQAAVLNVKLNYLAESIDRRKEIARFYDLWLKEYVGLPIKREVYQDYIIEVDDADALYDFLKARGIETMKNGYPFASQFTKGPKTVAYESRSLRIPCNPDLTDDEQAEVVAGIRMFYAQE